jgi:hypothetical protein
MAHNESRPRWGDGSRTSATKSVLTVARFGQPSNYSLSRIELARHVRELRRQGWQSWEIKQRFDYFWPAA